MDKLNQFQDILHHYVNSVSSVLATFLRPIFAVQPFISWLLLLAIISSIGNQTVIKIDPIFNAGLLSSLVFISLLMVSYWFVMTNINPARQQMAFSLLHVFAPNEQLSRAEARCMMRCGAPFFRFR